MADRGKKKIGAVLVSAASLLGLLLVWQVTAKTIDAAVILPPPRLVFSRFCQIVSDDSFLQHLGSSACRVGISFLLSLFLGGCIGVLSGLSEILREIFRPFLAVIRTVPVMAVILLAILWFPSDAVPIFAALLMAVPLVAGTMERAVRSLDRSLSEMADIFCIGKRDRFFKLVFPQILPSLFTSAQISLGLCWKVVIAGEILSIPGKGVGSEMQLAQLSIETEAVFAWTFVVISAAALSQLLIPGLERLMRKPKC